MVSARGPAQGQGLERWRAERAGSDCLVTEYASTQIVVVQMCLRILILGIITLRFFFHLEFETAGSEKLGN